MKLFHLLIYIVVFLFPCEVFSQKLFLGTVKNVEGERIPYVTISIGKGDVSLLTQRSDSDGKFNITIPDSILSEIDWIEAKHISYEIFRTENININQPYEITMNRKSINLDEIEIKSRPKSITTSGDTTRYSMQHFNSIEDRNIGDVLRRMPGVEVDANGQITHNGKAVKRMYVDGDDIFQNGYGIGTRSIQPKVVKNVEIINNHQHKKINREVQNSQDVAINLVLTDEAKMVWSGEATIGAAAPIDSYLNLNAMSFKKKFKNLSTLQYNSIGLGLANDVSAATTYNIIEPYSASSPSLAENKYYNNNSFAFNTNQFYKISKDWVATLSANTWFDKSNQISMDRMRYIIVDDTVSFNNNFITRRNPFVGNLKLMLESNADNFYMKNDLMYINDYNKNRTAVSGINDSTNQNSRDIANAILYSFELTPKLKNKDILSIFGGINKTYHNDELFISDAGNTPLANTLPNSFLNQTVSLPQFNTNLSVKYTTNQKRLKKSYFINGAVSSKTLQSQLRWYNTSDNELNKVSDDNNLKINQKYLTTGLDLDWKKNKTSISVSLPFILSNWNITDNGLSSSSKRFMFNPNATIQHKLRSGDLLTSFYKLQEFSNDINQMYRNPILLNFRELSTNNVPLNFSNSKIIGISYDLVRPIKMMYANVTASYSLLSSDYLLTNNITSQGIERSFINYENVRSTYSLSGNISKSFVKAKLNLNTNIKIGNSTSEQIMNDEIMDVLSSDFSSTSRIEYKGIKKLTIQYTFLFNKVNNRFKTEIRNNITSYLINSHNLSLLYFTKNSVFIKPIWNYSELKSSNFTPIKNGFLDLNIRYKPFTSKHSLELTVSNISNKKQYSSQTVASNIISSQIIPLRGRQFLLNYSFIF